jgi:hypothetical protein
LMCDLLVKCYEAIGELKKALVVAEKSLAHHCERGRAGGDQSAATVLRLRVLTGHSAEEDSAFCWSPACHLPAEGKLLCCSRCQTARYCGRECQKSHWPEHREECKRLASNATFDAGAQWPSRQPRAESQRLHAAPRARHTIRQKSSKVPRCKSFLALTFEIFCQRVSSRIWDP